MTSDKLSNPQFNWGDSILIKKSAPECYMPGSRGSICGLRTVDSSRFAQEFDQLIDSDLYLIEFEDGKAIEIPKSFLIFNSKL